MAFLAADPFQPRGLHQIAGCKRAVKLLALTPMSNIWYLPTTLT
jgi:hypothetical protein